MASRTCGMSALGQKRTFVGEGGERRANPIGCCSRFMDRYFRAPQARNLRSSGLIDGVPPTHVASVFSFHRESKATTTTSSNSTNVPSNPPRQACNVLRWPRKARNSVRRLRQACNVLRGLRPLNIYHLDIDGAGSARTV